MESKQTKSQSLKFTQNIYCIQNTTEYSFSSNGILEKNINLTTSIFSPSVLISCLTAKDFFVHVLSEEIS